MCPRSQYNMLTLYIFIFLFLLIRRRYFHIVGTTSAEHIYFQCATVFFQNYQGKRTTKINLRGRARTREGGNKRLSEIGCRGKKIKQYVLGKNSVCGSTEELVRIKATAWLMRVTTSHRVSVKSLRDRRRRAP